MPLKPAKILDGNNIFLELPAKKHGRAWVNIRERNHSFIQIWEPKWDKQLLTFAGYKKILKKFTRARKDWRTLIYFIIRKADNVLIGSISLSELNFGAAKSGKLGYWLGKEHAQKGYMTEAIALIARYGFSELNLVRIEAYSMAQNTASIKLLKKCNFTLEGEARSYLEINGFRENHLIFSLLKEDLTALAKQREQESFQNYLRDS